MPSRAVAARTAWRLQATETRMACPTSCTVGNQVPLQHRRAACCAAFARKAACLMQVYVCRSRAFVCPCFSWCACTAQLLQGQALPPRSRAGRGGWACRPGVTWAQHRGAFPLAVPCAQRCVGAVRASVCACMHAHVQACLLFCVHVFVVWPRAQRAIVRANVGPLLLIGYTATFLICVK